MSRSLPNAGELWLVDPETGRQLRVDTRSERLRARFAAAAEAERRDLARELSSLGVRHAVLSTSGDWLRTLVRVPAEGAVSFSSPLTLLWLLAVPALVLLYVVRERRRGRFAARWGSPSLLPNVVDRAPGRRRHLPVAILLVALAALLVGVARPHATVTVPREEATVLLAIDVSRSMGATDVYPTRLAAAQNAADRFVDQVPKKYRIGVVSFATRAQLAVAPTTDRSLVHQAIDTLHTGEGTAIGDAVLLAARLGQRERASDGSVPPTSVLLISDGARDGGRTAPRVAAQRARALHVPVYTVVARNARPAS